jgi:hypothetical protein
VYEVRGKTLILRVRELDTYFGFDCRIDLHRRCPHQGISCASRSLCCEIESFDAQVLITAAAVERPRQKAFRNRNKGIIGIDWMNGSAYTLPEERPRS